MRRNLKYAAALVVAGVAAATIYGVGSASGAGSQSFGPWGKGAPASAPDAAASQAELNTAPAAGTETIDLIAHSNADVFIDEAPLNKFSPGDRDIFTEQLRSTDQTETLGIDKVTCTKQIGNFFDCAGTAIFFGRGKIEFGGASGTGRFIHLPITGGSDEFSDAGGEVVVDTFSNGPDTSITINLLHLAS